ncbi:MAG TPA: hypothetical protein VGD37_33055 [Kofleriaceae bacterium]|jgi:hypothetical protein
MLIEMGLSRPFFRGRAAKFTSRRVASRALHLRAARSPHIFLKEPMSTIDRQAIIEALSRLVTPGGIEMGLSCPRFLEGTHVHD